MSAFICGPDHFIALAVFATGGARARVDPRYVEGITESVHAMRGASLATVYANTLYAANIRSVLHRYPKDTFESAPGLCEKPEEITVQGQHANHKNWVLKPVQILKMCDCLEYQSCEVDDWRGSTAWNLLNAIRKAAVRELPGYEDAEWEYEAPEQTRRAA